MIQIDTGNRPAQGSFGNVPMDGNIDMSDGVRADRFKRQTIEAIWACDDLIDLTALMQSKSLMLDALFMAHPAMAEEITAQEQECRAIMGATIQSAEADPTPAEPGNPNAQSGKTTKENTMNAFSNFDTGGNGSEGPWLQWSARGTQDGEIPAKSFLIRDDGGKKAFDGFTGGGVVLDIETMKTGWCYSSGAIGEAPDWKMNPTLDRFMEQPGEDYKKGFKIRCAIGSGETASWDQSGAGAWNAFCDLVPELAKQPAPGKLPLVRMTGSEVQQFKRGGTVKPILEVVEWVDRPDCLKEGAAAGVATKEPKKEAQTGATAGGF